MSVGRQAAHGVAWNMLFGISARIVQLVGTLILTRFISPDDYGAVLTASIAVMTANSFTTFAFGQYLIAKRADAAIAAQAAFVHVAIGIVTLAVVYALRTPLGNVLDTPAMGQYVWGYGLAVLIDRIRYVPERLIMRSMKFRTLATINGLGDLVLTSTSLAMASRWGAQAIMFGALARASFTSVLFLAAAPRDEWFVRVRLRANDVRDLFSYGFPIMISIVADRAAMRWDNLIVEKLFDPGVMGRYNLAYSLAEMPIVNVAEHIGEVLMPSFSRMEHDQRIRAVPRAASLMGLVVSPLGVGLGAVAPTVVATCFDARWAAMAPMLTILSVMTVFRPMTWSAIAYVQAVQQTRIVMWSSFMRAVVVLSLVATFGYLGGPIWACVGGGIGYALHVVITIIMTTRATELSTAEYLIGVARPLLPCIPMFLAVVGVQHALDGLVPLVVSLVIQIAVGGIVYIGAAFILVNDRATELVRLGRDAIRRRRA